MTKRRRRHSWALAFKRSDPDVQALSERGQTGLFYADTLARNAKERAEAALAGQPLPERLTAADLCGWLDNPIEIHTAIKQARIELFGKDLSNSAIAYRLQQRREREPRICSEPGCARLLSRLAHGSRHYCEEHGSGRARARRHRRHPRPV